MAKKELEKSEVRYRTLFNDSPLMLFTLDIAGKIVSVNRAGLDQLGYEENDLIGQPVLNVFYEDDKKSVVDSFNDCIENPEKVAYWEFRKVRKDGKIINVREISRVIMEPDGKKSVFVICEDVTEKKQSEETLRKKTDELEKTKKALLNVLEDERKERAAGSHD